MIRSFLISAAIIGLPACSIAQDHAGSTAESTIEDLRDRDGIMTTDWVVSRAAGLDALLLIGAAGGDVMQSEIYPEEIAWVRSNVSQTGLDAIDLIDQRLRQEVGVLTGPSMVYFFSANGVETLSDVIASAHDPRGRLQPALMTSPNWDETRFENAIRLMPTIAVALEALQEAGYSDWYDQNFLSDIDAGIARNREAVEGYDIIPEQANLLGRQLEPQIELLIANFSQPYGIRVLGQRFIAWHGYEAAIQLRIAAHEIFHPPFNPNDPALLGLLEPLETDPWVVSIVENHDPGFGYRTFGGVINEGSTQALDQIVSERLGFARDPALRWRHADGGMHMLAAALYHAMIEDGFAETGGVYQDWLISALDRGLLTPEETQRRAAAIVGWETVNQWDPARFSEN